MDSTGSDDTSRQSTSSTIDSPEHGYSSDDSLQQEDSRQVDRLLRAVADGDVELVQKHDPVMVV